MIPNAAVLTVEWVDTTLLTPRMDEPPVDLDQLRTYVERLAAEPEGHTTPVEIEPAPGGRFTIRNGRHRWLAHVALCIPRVRCLVVRS